MTSISITFLFRLIRQLILLPESYWQIFSWRALTELTSILSIDKITSKSLMPDCNAAPPSTTFVIKTPRLLSRSYVCEIKFVIFCTLTPKNALLTYPNSFKSLTTLSTKLLGIENP